MQSEVESVPSAVCANRNVSNRHTSNNELFRDLLSNGRTSNYSFYHKKMEPDSLIIANHVLGQKHTVDFHFKIAQGTENNHSLSVLNNVLCKHRRVPISLNDATYKDACRIMKAASTVDQNVINFYNRKLTNVALPDGTTIQSALRRGRYVQNAMVFSIECKTTGKNWTGLLPTKIKPHHKHKVNSRVLFTDVGPYIRRFMQMTNESYIRETKGIPEDTFDRIKVVGKLPEPVVYEVGDEFRSIGDQCYMLSTKIYTTLATSHLNEFCSIDTFPVDRAMDYDASVLIFA